MAAPPFAEFPPRDFLPSSRDYGRFSSPSQGREPAPPVMESPGRRHTLMEKEFYRVRQDYATLTDFERDAQPHCQSNSYATLPAETLYVIDKLVRVRGQRGKYGADYSRVFGLEREDHVDRIDAVRMNSRIEGLKAERAMRAKHADFARRLNHHLCQSEGEPEAQQQQARLSFGDWLERKNRERRLKKRLTEQALEEFEQLLRSQEEEDYSAADFDRQTAIEHWCSRKEGLSMKRSVLTDQELERPWRSFAQWQAFKRRHL